jgi:Lipocalin-like domain
MNRRRLLSAIPLAAVTVAVPTVARAQSPVVGAWERVSLVNAEGKPTQPPAPPAFLIFSADGFFSQSAVPTGRPKIAKPLDQMTKEELLARFTRLETRRGTYTISGNRLTRRNVTHGDPTQEGSEQTQLYRVEGDTLILSSNDPKLKNEARFRRVK